jgi:molecular chaperone DnaK (HSP70)
MAAYFVGIDLGTTHTVVACARATGGPGETDIRVVEIDQLIAPGEVAARPLLPSLRYHPAEGELPPGALVLPWGSSPEGAAIGTLARRLGARVPGRLVASAKSWLSHAAVDRLAPILPWGAAADVPRVSPVAASASILAHVRAAWNHRHPKALLEDQSIVLTVPASFDDAARELTLQAARDAGLPRLRLLEEPQAALQDWLYRHRQSLSQALGGTRLILVCDVGGGTTDLSLVRVDGRPEDHRFERVAVGQHLMLGGDNMDLALAHQVERRLPGADAARPLSPGEFSQLVEQCRAAKERLLAADAPGTATVTLAGSGGRLIGGARSVTVTREEVEHLVLDGFFPAGAADELPRRARPGAGLVTFGLPYAADAAVTRHIAAFLQQHADAGSPDALLLNGGVFHADAIVRRLEATLAGWRGEPLRRLPNTAADTAVARGAVAHALASLGSTVPRIGSGSARNYFLLLAPDPDGARRGVCVLPRGTDEGRDVPLPNLGFALQGNQPVRFDLMAATSGSVGAGTVVDLAEQPVAPLPPLTTVVRLPGRDARRDVPVHLTSRLTELGTLEVECTDDADPSQTWKLHFQLRQDGSGPSGGPHPRLVDAVAAIDRVFGPRDRAADAKAVKQLRAQLEALLGPRERWGLALLRPLFDELMRRARNRRRSADHERLWFSLAGWCLRPGFGDPLDGWRIEQLWPLFEPGVQHGRDAQVCAEWWTLWRRVAAGLDDEAQQRVLQDVAFNLRGHELGPDAHQHRSPTLVKGHPDDMVRMAASLERAAPEHKTEIGDWLLGQIQRADKSRHAPDLGHALWALGRLGARVPFHASAHAVVPPDTASRWITALLLMDWRRTDGAAAAAANIGRLSGDRARDLPPDLRQAIAERLQAARAPVAWLQRLHEVVALDEAGERSIFGESLPVGLKLIGQ